jgi:hypothetical protein
MSHACLNSLTMFGVPGLLGINVNRFEERVILGRWRSGGMESRSWTSQLIRPFGSRMPRVGDSG